MPIRNASPLLAGLLLLGLAACSGVSVEEPKEYRNEPQDRIRDRYGTITGNEDGFVLYSTRRSDEDADSFGGGLAVNPFLWRAALETIDFMPLVQSDPVGGVIITDWYAPPEAPDERFKATVYILGRALRADGVRVSLFRQVRDQEGWRDAEVEPGTAARLEESILGRARELRVAADDTAG